MSVSSHVVETPEDLEVKRKAWVWNKRVLLKYVTQYAKAADPATPSIPTKNQNAIVADAENEKFPKSLVRKLGKLRIRINSTEDSCSVSELEAKFTDALREYAEKLGLGQAYK